MSTKKITQAARLGCYMRANMHMVLLALDWTEEDYHAFFFEQGWRYLHMIIPDYEQAVAVAKERKWWGWWKLHWFQREAEWVHLYNTRSGPIMTLGGRKLTYTRMHDAYNLFASKTGSGKVLEDSYCKDFVNDIKQ